MLPVRYKKLASKIRFPEQQEAEALFHWVQLQEDVYPELRLFFAVPNGGARPKIHNGKATFSPEAARMKLAGVRKGVSDYLLLCARGRFHGMALELKAGKNKPTKEQAQFLVDCKNANYHAVWCRGWVEARELILDYLKLDVPHAQR